jgi:hypothetical protein
MIRIYKPDKIITYVFLQYRRGVDEGGREVTLTWLVCEEAGEGGGAGGEGDRSRLGQRRACRI